jgi:hypothetical protein
MKHIGWTDYNGTGVITKFQAARMEGGIAAFEALICEGQTPYSLPVFMEDDKYQTPSPGA